MHLNLVYGKCSGHRFLIFTLLTLIYFPPSWFCHLNLWSLLCAYKMFEVHFGYLGVSPVRKFGFFCASVPNDDCSVTLLDKLQGFPNQSVSLCRLLTSWWEKYADKLFSAEKPVCFTQNQEPCSARAPCKHSFLWKTSQWDDFTIGNIDISIESYRIPERTII